MMSVNNLRSSTLARSLDISAQEISGNGLIAQRRGRDDEDDDVVYLGMARRRSS